MDGAIYYPYIRVPESAWFTRAILYWDSVGTIVPDEWTYEPERLGSYTRDLVRRGLVTQILPSYADLTAFARRFADYISRLQPEEIASRRSGFSGGIIELIHRDKGPEDIFQYLRELRLCSRDADASWWRVESKTSSDYMACLALALSIPGHNITQIDPDTRDHLEIPEAARLVPITDRAHSLEPLLTGTVEVPPLSLLKRAEGQVMIGEIQTMVLDKLFPAPVTAIQPSEIEGFRKKHSDLLPAFRRSVEARIDEIFDKKTGWQRQRALERLEGEFEDAIKEVEAYMSESHFGKIARSPWLALVGIIPGLDRIIGGARAVADVADPAPDHPKNILAYAAFASVEFSRNQRRPRKVRQGTKSLIGTAIESAV